MALDDRRVILAGFDHVRVDCPLRQIIHRAELLPHFLKHADERLTDALALLLRLRYAREPRKEPFLRVDANQADIPPGKRRHNFVALGLAQQSVVDEHAGELTADSLRQQRRAHGRVRAARQRQQHPSVPNLFANRSDGTVLIASHAPIPRHAADAVEEIPQHLRAVLRVRHLRVKLDAVESP